MGFDDVKQLGLPITLAFALLAASPASSSSWQEAGSGAVAILPAPEKASGITGASLFCAEQRWSFLLRLEPGSLASDTNMPGVLTAGGTRFAVEGLPKNGQLVVPLAPDMLGPIKASTRMKVEMDDKGKSLKAEFALAASRVVIERITSRCSPVDMSAYERVALSETDPASIEARDLLTEEARLFREATGLEPAYAARKLELADGKALLLASVCGSTAYYGVSGCSVFGFARQDAGEKWRLVYDTEGVQLYLDDKAGKDGFPALLTLPMTGAAEPSRWAWTGSAYEIRDEMMAEGHHTDASQAQ
jgi:hypothetical protein